MALGPHYNQRHEPFLGRLGVPWPWRKNGVDADAPAIGGDGAGVRSVGAGLLLAASSSLAYADTGRRVALVIGNGAYQNAAHLPNPPNDARAVAEALRGLDFEVIEAVDLDQPDMLARVDEFSARLEGADTGLFYYAGHGLQVAGENYLVPIDARLQREAQVRLQTLPLQTVLATMEAAVATRIVLLDACRDNPLAQQLKRSMAASRSSAVGQGLAEVRTAVGTLIAYATGPGDVASDGEGEHSPFTAALLDHIATPGLEVRQVLGRVRDEVLKQTGERQVPWDSSSLRGEFYFKPAAPRAPLGHRSTLLLQKPLPAASGYDGLDREAFEVIAAALAAPALATGSGVVDLDPARELGLVGLARAHRPHQLVLDQPHCLRFAQSLGFDRA